MTFHKSVMGRGIISDGAKKLSEVIERVKKTDEALEWQQSPEPMTTPSGNLMFHDGRWWVPQAGQSPDPTDPGHDVEVLREHVRHLERHIRQLAGQSQSERAVPVQRYYWHRSGMSPDPNGAWVPYASPVELPEQCGKNTT